MERKLFVVTNMLHLNETDCPMKPGQEGFAYLPLTDPVELELNNIEYTVARSAFEAATRWKISD
jgi:hypothetical protein